MANSGVLFLSNDKAIINSEGIPELPDEQIATYYKIMNTGISSLFSVLSEENDSTLNQVYTDGSFIEGTYELEKEFTSWTFEFDSQLIDSLASINLDNTDQLVEAWQKTEDRPYDNEKDLTDLIHSLTLKAFAKKGQQDELRMFFREDL